MTKECEKAMDKIRAAISESKCSEREIYEELMAEAVGWRMRLEELDAEGEA